MKLRCSNITIHRTKIAIATVIHVCLSYFFVNEPAITKMHTSAALADCFEGFGAIIGVVAMSYLAFERPLGRPFLERRFWPYYLMALLLLILSAIAANLTQSNAELYGLRLAIGAVEACLVLAALVFVLHTDE